MNDYVIEVSVGDATLYVTEPDRGRHGRLTPDVGEAYVFAPSYADAAARILLLALPTAWRASPRDVDVSETVMTVALR